uniref:Protein kinase domain-containing protein n=1 Tax=Globodera rostochiensis TaxID=31243 RepID=A0A914HKH4_GLORO
MLNNKHAYLFLLFFYILCNFISAHPPHNFPNFYLNCLSRCVAKCFDESQRFTQNDQRLLPRALTECQTKCRLYGQPDLCGSNNDCWKRCKDLGPSEDQSDENKGHHPKLQAPNDVEMIYNENTTIDVSWHQTSAPNGEPTKIYLLQIETEVPNHQITQIFTSEHSIDGMTPALIESICGPISIKVASASAKHELSQWSKKVQLDSEGPQIAGKMELVHVKFNSTPFNFEDYIANATLDIELRFIMNAEWPMGIEDLEVAPLFHLVGCNTPNLEQPLPAPEFHRGTRDDTVQTIVGADLMYRRCKFAYAVEEVRSNRCGSSFHFSPGQNELQFFEMNCDTVAGSDCRRTTKSNLGAPLCGQFSDFNFTVIEEIINETAQTERIAVNLTFTPNNRIMKMHPEYYVALFGNAKELRNIDRALMSQTVDMIDILGEQTNCADFSTNKSCKRIKNANSIVLDGLVRNKLYGVLLCAVRDPNNLSYPVNETNKSFKPQVFRLFLQPRESVKNVSEENAGKEREHYMLWIVGGSGILCAVLLLLIVTIFFAYCRQRDKNRKNQINMENMRRNRDQRYTDFPARNREDQWELERRKLIIYEDKRLGSGAFGSVYLGKLVGLQNGKQPLSIGLLRAENSLVAVKMLPEYADEVSKSEFLREIGLMKSLGFHERLVNMLACVTQSEPYCLVVEYCSDGDLLQFLRARCKYMLELNEAGVKYTEPNCETDFDRAMIMTVKQLLVFAVQISYGLEYLSQKGFVHRDVAARNILVQDKTYAKIGDFGLCRFIYADSDNYKSRGGRLPIKWMAPEAIRHYEFTTSSDVWSFGVLMFEIITLGGTPYPGMQPDDMLLFLESGKRMSQPDNCPDDFYRVMCSCWTGDPRLRLEFAQIRQQLALQLENVSDEYAYLKLDAKKDYYNVSYGELRALCGEVGKQSVEDQNDKDDVDKMEPENVA